jgi:hypothetical protein
LPGYFFNILDDKGFIPGAGVELADDKAAIAEAYLRARRMLADNVIPGKEVDGRTVQVKDERGFLIYAIRLGDLV